MFFNDTATTEIYTLGFRSVIPRWSITVWPRHHVPPISTATKQRRVAVATEGSSATAMAIGSGRANPSKGEFFVDHSLATFWISTQNSASGVPTFRNLAESSPSNTAYL